MSSDLLLRLYHAMPHPARQMAATARGLVLRRWRYGPETERLVAEALQRESWTAEQWASWQGDRLVRVLRRAAATVPHYRAHWQERRRRGDNASIDVLSHWPILRKEEVRRAPELFVASDRRIGRLFPETTSGTTGKPLRLWWGRETVREWFGLFEARIRRWNGISRQDRWAILGGQLIVPARQARPPFWVWNGALRQLYLSTHHLSPDNAADYLKALRAHGVISILGYPSALYALAHAALERNLSAPPLRVAIGNAEPMFSHQRAAIERVFQCPVRDTYGMAEIVAAGSECAAGVMHAWPEVGVLEVLNDDDETVGPGSGGRVVGTSLLNPAMPLIRYDTGDRAARLADTGACACGRLLPALASIEGRSDDVVITPEGRRIGRLDPVFKGDFPIVEAQIVQETLDRITVRVVPAAGFTSRTGQEIERRVRARVGDRMSVAVVSVSGIERSSRGKFRAVISHLSSPETASGDGPERGGEPRAASMRRGSGES